MSNNIRKIIESKGLKVRFIAETAGISRQNLSRLINYPEQSTNLETAIKICKALDEPIDKVFTDVNWYIEGVGNYEIFINLCSSSNFNNVVCSRNSR